MHILNPVMPYPNSIIPSSTPQSLTPQSEYWAKSMPKAHAARREASKIRKYLVALEAEQRLNKIKVKLGILESKRNHIKSQAENETDVLKKLDLMVRKESLDKEINSLKRQVKKSFLSEEMEQDFIRLAKIYSERKGISKRIWLQIGVPKSVVEKAFA